MLVSVREWQQGVPGSMSAIAGNGALAFPAWQPASYVPLAEEPRFDAAQHLAIELPARTWSLAELDYAAAEIAGVASPVG